MTISLSVTDADEIFRRYYRPLCLYALHYLRSTEDAEDVVQDCLTDFLERSLLAERPENVKSYLYIMVRNRCLDTLRRDSHIDRSLSAEEFDERIAESEYEEASFIEARMWTAIDSLPERCREVFLMSKRDGLKYEEIADELGISVNTVRNQISKALKTLKEGCHRVYMFFFG
ncbi:MAG: RNA polymerase sigma-70 factor [Duncaniella sp.]|nr:RNA polymerase sigma-70 factor [Duncaniella sp.]